MTIKFGPNVADHNMQKRGVEPQRVLKQFLLDAAISAMMKALNEADDVLDHNWVDCSGDWDDEPYQTFVVKLRYDTEDEVDVEQEFEFKLVLNDNDEGWTCDSQP